MNPKKALGQHWLKDKVMLEAILDSGNLTPDDVVLEIGPGEGDLTKLLADRVKKVVACEFDDALLPKLQRMLPGNVEIIGADILSFNLALLPADYKVVANIPYYITAKIIKTLLTATNSPHTTILLIQKEVAQRLVSGRRSLLSISAEVYADVSLGVEIPARFFVPPPKVDSQVVVLVRRPKPLVHAADQKAFFRTVKAGFSAKRKKLRSSLAAGLGIDKLTVVSLLEQANVDPDARAETLTVAQWNNIATLVSRL